MRESRDTISHRQSGILWAFNQPTDQMKTLNAHDQLNKSFHSLAELKRWGENLKQQIAGGRPVWIGQDGYGISRYALFNVPRWHPVHGDYICRLEFNGELPRNWRDFLRTLALPSE